ncbi:MAG: zf-HC2 domain-containing protein [Spongiibacteraceae bacterium]
MLSCRELAHRHASDYLDGQLGWRARLGVRFHLMLCDNCRRFVAQLRKVRVLLRNPSIASAPIDKLPPDPATQELAAKLADAYQQQKITSEKKSPPRL